MSRVMYSSKRLIPVQSVVITKNYQKTGDGTKIGSLFELAVNGTLIAYKGSPMTSGFWTGTGYPPDETSIVSDETRRLASIERKKEYLRQLFADEGLQFEVQSDDGSPPMKCNPRIVGIDFKEDIEHTKCMYTVKLEADILYGGPFIAPSGEDNFSHMLAEATEDWNLEINDSPEFAGQNINNFAANQTYRLTHNVSAIGKRFYDSDGTLSKQPWEWAREWVQARLGIDTDKILSSGVMNLPAVYTGYNHVRGESTDELGGRYSVFESWILSSSSAIETFNVTSKRSVESALTTVNIEGQVQGLETRDSDYQLTQNKYTAAAARYATVSGLAFTRAQSLTNTTLNVRPQSESTSHFYSQGSIQYSYEYNDRPSNNIRGAIYEDISISEVLSTDVFASIPVLGRAAGPVLQNINTITAPTRTLSIQAVMGKQDVNDLRIAFNHNPRVAGDSASDIQSIMTAANPLSNQYEQVYVSDYNEQWNPFRGTYSLSITWTYQA